MQMLSERLQKQVVKIWRSVATEIEDRYGLSPQELPSQILLEPLQSTSNDLDPGLLKPDSIIINSNVELYERLLPATVTKLCFQSALPSDSLCSECIDDFSFEFARRKIQDNVLRSHWETLWSEHTPPRRLSKVTTYHPCVAYSWLHSVAGDNGLDTFVRELTHRAKHHLPLTFDEYVDYFQMRIRRFENRLDNTELKIVKHLIEDPDIRFTDLAKSVGVTNEWVSKKISQLKKRMVLRKFNQIPFSRIDIRMYHLLMARGSSDRDLFSAIKFCPFLYSFRRVMTGDWGALATLCVPDNPQSSDYLEQGLDLIEKSGVVIRFHPIASSGVSHCFDYYSLKSKDWDVPWELTKIQLQRIQTSDLATSIPRIDTPEMRLETKLDELDMRILDCVKRRISSVSKIREELKVGQHRVANKLRRLREKELIVTTWEAHNIGLSEHVVVYVKDRDVAESIAAWSLRLPRTIITFSNDKELILLVDLPRGGSYGLSSALGELETKISIGILSASTYGSWIFPTELWDSNYQKWRCPEDDIKKWITSLT
jgi:DNA-binding Lrp family transcriptional regulator